GRMSRPGLAEGRALVGAAMARWRQARVDPLVPRLDVGYTAGLFGGGRNEFLGDFGGRGDGTVAAVWELHNLGAGDLARARARQSQYRQARPPGRELPAPGAPQVGAP